MTRGLTRQDIFHFEVTSTTRSPIRPFTATIHAPEDVPLSTLEKSLIQDALVQVAHAICERRGLKPGEPFWEGEDNV